MLKFLVKDDFSLLMALLGITQQRLSGLNVAALGCMTGSWLCFLMSTGSDSRPSNKTTSYRSGNECVDDLK